MNRTAHATLALTLLLVSASCASTRQVRLRQGLDDHRYPRAPAEVWPEVQRLVHERGYPLAGADREAVGAPARSRVLEALSPGFDTRTRATGGRILESNADDRGVRLRAEAIPAGTGGCRVVFTRLKRDDTNPAVWEETRDVELELALLQRIDPAAAAVIEGVPVPAAARPAGLPAAADPWQPVRHLVGTWEAAPAGGRPAVTWAIDFAAGGQRMEIHGSPLLGPGAAGAGADEMGVITRDPARGRLVWRQFTASGQVNQYLLEKSDGDRLVFVTEQAEALPAGGRARLTLGSDGPDELVAVFEQAEPGKDFTVSAETRLRRKR